MSRTLGISAENHIKSAKENLGELAFEPTNMLVQLPVLASQNLPALVPVSAYIPPQLSELKPKKRWFVATLGILCAIILILGGAWQLGAFSPYTSSKPEYLFTKLFAAPSSNISVSSTRNISDFVTCTAQTSSTVNVTPAITGCTYGDQTYLKTLENTALPGIITEQDALLAQNTLSLRPLLASELTSFRVGKDIGSGVIVGNIVYSANINANSENFGLMYLTSPFFASLTPDQKAQYEKLAVFLRTQSGYDAIFFSLFATDKKSLARPSILITPLSNAVAIGADQHFAPTLFSSVVITKTDLVTPVFAVQVWMQVDKTMILLEEEFSQNQNNVIKATIVEPCKKEVGEDNAKLSSCIAQKFVAEKDQSQYAENLMISLVNKFQIK